MATSIIFRKSIATARRLPNYNTLLKNGFFISQSLSSSLPNHHPPLHQPQEIQVGSLGVKSMPKMYHHHHWRSLCTTISANATSTVTQETKDQSKSSSQGTDGSGSSGGDRNNSKQQGKPVRGGPVSWLSFLLLIATGAGLIFYYDREKKQRIQEINTASTAVKQGPSAGKAAIGGPFNLIDDNGKAVTNKDFTGKWTVIYFGFTHCPDICPDELQKLAAAVDKIKSKSGIEIVPIFISVDPERDNVEQVHEYVNEFHPALIGLTGTPEEIKKVARAFRVYYMKTEEEGSDYLVDHSIVMYLMDPNMEFVKFYGKNNDVDSLTDGIINEIKQYRKPKS